MSDAAVDNFPGDILGPPPPGEQVVYDGGWYELTGRAMYITARPQDVSWDQWWTAGGRFAVTATMHKFWIADWLRFGAWKWGEKFAQAQVLFPHYDEQTLMNIQRVGNRIPSTRRITDGRVSFEHHEVVASQPPEKQDEYLQLVVNKPDLRREDLRDLVRADKHGSNWQIVWQRAAVEAVLRKLDWALDRAGESIRGLLREAQKPLHEALKRLDAELQRREKG